MHATASFASSLVLALAAASRPCPCQKWLLQRSDVLLVKVSVLSVKVSVVNEAYLVSEVYAR